MIINTISPITFIIWIIRWFLLNHKLKWLNTPLWFTNLAVILFIFLHLLILNFNCTMLHQWFWIVLKVVKTICWTSYFSFLDALFDCWFLFWIFYLTFLSWMWLQEKSCSSDRCFLNGSIFFVVSRRAMDVAV